jgi:branched-chain amino acid transport system substrate-binding protein
MRRVKIFSLFLFLFICLLFSNPAFAVDKNYVQGVSDNEILIGMLFPLTGPAAFAGLGNSQGAELYINKVNAEGGIHGRKMKVMAEDTACQPVKGVASLQKLLSQRVFMVFGGCCSGVVLSLLETISLEGIPLLVPSASSPKITSPLKKSVFRCGPFPDHIQSKAVVDYDIHSLKARRIAIISDTSEYGQGGTEGITGRLAEYGLKPVAVEKMNTGDTDFSSQILRVKDKNPEVVHLYMYPKEAIILVRQAQRAGLNAKFIGSGALNNPAFFEAAPVGTLVIHSSRYSIDSPEPHIVDMVKELKANYRISPNRPTNQEMLGTGGAMVLVEGLRRAGRDLTWQKYIDALESIRDFDTGFIEPVSFSPTQHHGTRTGRFLIVRPNQKWELLPDTIGVREKVKPLSD